MPDLQNQTYPQAHISRVANLKGSSQPLQPADYAELTHIADMLDAYVEATNPETRQAMITRLGSSYGVNGLIITDSALLTDVYRARRDCRLLLDARSTHTTSTEPTRHHYSFVAGGRIG